VLEEVDLIKSIPVFEAPHAAEQILHGLGSTRQDDVPFDKVGLDFDEGDVGRDGPLELKEEMAPRERGPLNDLIVELDPSIQVFDLLSWQTPGQRGEGFFPFADGLLIAFMSLLGDTEIRAGGTVEEEVAEAKEQTEAEPCHGELAQAPSLLDLR
jgi:hypothetical protein